MRSASAFASLIALALAVVGWAAWPATSGDSARPIAPTASTSDVSEAIAPAQVLRAPDPPQGRSEGAFDAAPSPAPRCPDLAQAVAGHSARLRERTRSLERDWAADSAMLARAFDAHCARELAKLGAQHARSTEERLAAWSLAGADAGLAREAAPDAAALAWLWSRVQSAPSRPADSDEADARRASDAARTAALCLAWLGAPADRARLVQALGDDALAEAAAFGLRHARDVDVAAPFAAALEADDRAGERARIALVRARGLPPFLRSPAERELAMRAVESWWRRQAPAGAAQLTAAPASLALAALDPDAAARAWGERLDARGFEPGTARWCVPQLARGPADAQARLKSLLRAAAPEARLELASEALALAPRDPAAASLVDAGAESLAGLLREAESADMRLRAARALARADASAIGPRAALAGAVSDLDERVREAARAALEAAADG